MGRKRNKHRRCVEVATITGIVTFTYRDNDPSTKCLRRLKNLNFKLAFTNDQSVLFNFPMWQLASEA